MTKLLMWASNLNPQLRAAGQYMLKLAFALHGAMQNHQDDGVKASRKRFQQLANRR
jgi:hypothetical protein